MTKKCKLILKDEVNCKFDNLDVKTRRKLQNATKYFMPYARHLPSFKLGRWDGTKSLCTVSGQTHIHLLEKLLPIVVDQGYEIELDDQRQTEKFDFEQIDENHLSHITWPKGHRFEGEPIKLRDYQVEAINLFLENPLSLGELATGSGKTIITACLSKIVGEYGRTIIIVPNTDLVIQTQEDYLNIGLDVGLYYGSEKNWNADHVICTWQSLDRIFDQQKVKKETPERQAEINKIAQELLNNVKAVIVDEVHMAKADHLYMLLTKHFNNVPIRWGLTGTIPKEDFDRECIFSALGPVKGKLAAHTLQEKGVLSKLQIDILQLKDRVTFTNYHSEHQYLVCDKKRIEWISNFVTKISENGNTLLLVDRIKTGELLQEYIPDGVFVYGSTKSDERKDHYESISKTNNKIIFSTYKVAAVGINIPRIFNLVLLEPGKSFVRVIQSIGRGIRKAKDKDFVQIYDITSSCKWSKRHLTERKKFYKEAEYPFEITKIDWQNI